MAVQTPQAFEREMYLYALRKAQSSGLSYTDDCQLIEAAGGRVKFSAGSYINIKLTTPEDRLAAGVLKKEDKAMRIGSGYDVHQLAEGRRLILGGVEIPLKRGCWAIPTRTCWPTPLRTPCWELPRWGTLASCSPTAILSTRARTAWCCWDAFVLFAGEGLCYTYIYYGDCPASQAGALYLQSSAACLPRPAEFPRLRSA